MKSIAEEFGYLKYGSSAFLFLSIRVMELKSKLSNIRELSEYSIWYLCGSKWSNIYILNFLRVFVILLVSVLLNIIVLFTPYAQENLLYNSILTMKECIATGGILLAILLISNGLVFYTVKTNSPVDILRRFYKE